ncbi:MAG: sulfatase-like hydrolase/transferase [Candidatus Zipacnadales bacterium]
MSVSRRQALKAVGGGITAAALTSVARNVCSAILRPNILWISCEDMSPHLGCYGDPHARTPNLDRLAVEGTRYTRAFAVAGVCAPSRSGIITGMYPSTLGSTYMRCNIRLPKHVKCFPEYLRERGYYCTNNAKTDYQFKPPSLAWDECSNEAHWRNREPGQPFFAVFNFTITHESQYRTRGDEYAKKIGRLRPEDRQDPTAMTTLPPYYPDTLEARTDWAHYYELVTVMDYQAGDVLRELEEDGLAEHTIVFFWSDHGVGLPRAKRWLYDSGTHVPLIVRIPESFRQPGQGEPGSVDDRLVSLIDLGPTVLNLAGVPVPEHMHGQPFLGAKLPPPRRYVFGVRDRIDEREDMVRTVRDTRYRYVRNYKPYLPYFTKVSYAEVTPTMQELRRLHAEGELLAEAELWLAESRPTEELYDTQTDPHELNNLATSAEHQRILRRLRRPHLKWASETNDLGLLPEALVAELEQRYGTREAILKQPENQGLQQRLLQIVEAGERGEITSLCQALCDSQPGVRWWAAMWLGNHRSEEALEKLRQALNDEAMIVRVAAARALCRMGHLEEGLPPLISLLRDENEWVRLAAATELDYLDEEARPALEMLKAAMESDNNDYVKRVAAQAIAELGE